MSASPNWQSKCFCPGIMKSKHLHHAIFSSLHNTCARANVARSFGCFSSRQPLRLRFTFTLILFLISAAQMRAQNALAGDPQPPPTELSSRKYALGHWGGARSTLEEKGVVFDLFYITDLQANPSSGLEQTRAGWERFRGTVDFNFDRVISWQGLSFHATGLWQWGGNLGGKIGTLANPSDLVSPHTTRLDSF